MSKECDGNCACSEELIIMAYFKKILEFISSNTNKFDKEKVFVEGFSQNSGGAGKLAFCFPDKVAGLWTGSDWYWQGLAPVCYNQVRPMVSCVSQYTNDPTSIRGQKMKKGLKDSTAARKMYNALVKEGHDARLLSFAPSSTFDKNDKSIEGSHKYVMNDLYWKVGCLGLAQPCSEPCEASFISCVKSKDLSTAKMRTESFKQCIGGENFSEDVEKCSAGCAPTYKMLVESQTPYDKEFSAFGSSTIERGPQPEAECCGVRVEIGSKKNTLSEFGCDG